jgi:hypothetical protein
MTFSIEYFTDSWHILLDEYGDLYLVSSILQGKIVAISNSMKDEYPSELANWRFVSLTGDYCAMYYETNRIPPNKKHLAEIQKHMAFHKFLSPQEIKAFLRVIFIREGNQLRDESEAEGEGEY